MFVIMDDEIYLTIHNAVTPGMPSATLASPDNNTITPAAKEYMNKRADHISDNRFEVTLSVWELAIVVYKEVFLKSRGQRNLKI